MKRNHILAGITACSIVAGALGAETKMTWGFATGDNPALGQPDAANPFPATGTAEVTKGVGVGYIPGTFVVPGFDFGTATGLWDIGPGGVKMDIDLYAATPTTKLDYRVVVGMFASTGLQPGFPYSPNVSFSIPGGQLTGDPLVKETTTSGQWIESTYTWQQLSVNGPLTLTMSAEAGRGLLLDSLSFSVMGDLVPIPEPSVAQLGALAVLMLGIGAVRSRKTVR
jgi:hypothetical protein